MHMVDCLSSVDSFDRDWTVQIRPCSLHRMFSSWEFSWNIFFANDFSYSNFDWESSLVFSIHGRLYSSYKLRCFFSFTLFRISFSCSSIYCQIQIRLFKFAFFSVDRNSHKSPLDEISIEKIMNFFLSVKIRTVECHYRIGLIFALKMYSMNRSISTRFSLHSIRIDMCRFWLEWRCSWVHMIISRENLHLHRVRKLAKVIWTITCSQNSSSLFVDEESNSLFFLNVFKQKSISFSLSLSSLTMSSRLNLTHSLDQ